MVAHLGFGLLHCQENALRRAARRPAIPAVFPVSPKASGINYLRRTGRQGYMAQRCTTAGRRMLELLQFISYLITLYTYVVIAVVIVSWLMAFGVINAYNPMVRSIWQGLNAVTEPLLRPIRNALPNMGGLDISPVILLLLCYFIQTVILPNIAKAVV
jgi:YggT family protein